MTGFYVITSRQYHDPPDGFGPFESGKQASEWYDRLYEQNPDHPIFDDEVTISRVVDPKTVLVESFESDGVIGRVEC
jgi:hypothetical protein